MARRFLLAALLLLVVATGGCLDPYRAHVPASVLDANAVPWVEERHAQASEGFLGPRVRETEYAHDPPGDAAPFPGRVQVFSLRGLDAADADTLLSWARDAVDRSVRRENISLSPDAATEGERTLRNGLETRWFVEEGIVRQDGGLFDEDVTVRIVAEVGYDGRARTSVVSVALVQVSRVTDVPGCNPLLPGCANEIRQASDLRTWRSVVGDPDATITGMRSETGLLWNLRTHG